MSSDWTPTGSDLPMRTGPVTTALDWVAVRVGWLSVGVGYAACAMVMLMMVHITLDVLGKNILNEAMPATIEMVSNYYMVFVAFAAICLAELRDRHISVEVVTNLMPKVVERHLWAHGMLLSAAVYATLTWLTLETAIERTQKGSFIMGGQQLVYIWPAYWILPAAFAVMALVLILRWIYFMIGRPDPAVRVAAPRENIGFE